jgi:O-antigen/teichoic acid export membrane protein
LDLLRPQRRELARFAISTNLSATLSLINKDSELLWVSYLRNPLETGYYKLALALANLVQLPISPLPQATYPELSREAARRNWSNVRYVLRQGSLLAGGYTLAASLGLLLLGRWVIRFFYNPEYLPAYPAVLILLVGFLVANTFYWHRTALLAVGRPDFPTKVNLVLAVLKVAGALALVSRFGYLASAGLLAGSYLLGVTVSVFKFRGEVARQDQLAAP